MTICFVMSATRSAKVRTRTESGPVEKRPVEVGCGLVWLGGIAAAECPIRYFSESDRRMSKPFSSSTILILSLPSENSFSNSSMSSKGMVFTLETCITLEKNVLVCIRICARAGKQSNEENNMIINVG